MTHPEGWTREEPTTPGYWRFTRPGRTHPPRILELFRVPEGGPDSGRMAFHTPKLRYVDETPGLWCRVPDAPPHPGGYEVSQVRCLNCGFFYELGKVCDCFSNDSNGEEPDEPNQEPRRVRPPAEGLPEAEQEKP